MKNTIKSFLATLLILSTESKSVESEPEKSHCLCAERSSWRAEVEEECRYFPLFRVSNREQKFTSLYCDIVFEMPNNPIRYLYESVGCNFYFPTAYVYLKFSNLEMKELNNHASGKILQENNVIPYLEFLSHNFENPRGNILGDVRHALHCSNIIDGIFAHAFETQLPLDIVMSPSLMKNWTVRMSTRPMDLMRETCKCTSKMLRKSIIETGNFETCDIGSFLSFEPFDLKIVKLSAPGTKVFMYPQFDFVESFSHIKDILLINAADMVYINNTSLQDLPKEIWGLIINMCFSIVQFEFNKTAKIVYETKFKNIKNN